MNPRYFLKLLATAFLCSAVGILIYLNTLRCGIVYDDEPAIKKNQDLRPHTPWTDLFIHDFWGAEMTSTSSHKSYRPLCVATYRLNYLLHGLEPIGYHLVNVLLHGSVCFFFVFLCGVIFCDCIWPSAIAGMVFAVHPIHTEAVAGLVGRTELLSALFFILAFLSYQRSISNDVRWRWILLTLFFSLCSVLSKEQGITVVAVCVTYEFFIHHKMTWSSSLHLLGTLTFDRVNLPKWFSSFLTRSLSLAAFTIIFVVLRVYLMKGGPIIFTQNVNPPLFMETPYRQLNWLYLVFVNTWQLLNPNFLCPDWRFGTIPLITSITDPRNILTMLTFASIIYLGVHSVRYNTNHAKMLFFGLSLTIFPFIPASNLFFPVGFVVAERVLYSPSMGFCFVIGYGIFHLLKMKRHFFVRGVVILCLLGLIGLMASRVIRRNKEWESNATLYTSGVRCNSKSGVMLTNLGIEHGRMKNFSFAEKLYRRSMEIAPEHSRGYSNFGGLMEALKKYDKAEEALRKAVILGVKDSTGTKVLEAYTFLINSVILRKGSDRYQDALDLWDQALAAYPKYAYIYGMKGSLLQKIGLTKEAREPLELSVQSKVGIADPYYYLGMNYLVEEGVVKQKRMGLIENLFKRALEIDPNHSMASAELSKLKQSR